MYQENLSVAQFLARRYVGSCASHTRERKGEVEDPGMELGIGILRKQKRSVHRAEVPSRCKTTKTSPPCAYEVHHTYTYKRYLRISIYVPQSFSFNTHLLTTYLPRISTNNNQDISTYLPQIKFHPNPSNPVPTYLVHSTNHLTFSYTPLYLPVLYPYIHRVGESAGR